MILLVTDTSGKNGSVALARAGEGPKPSDVEVIEESPLTGGTFSAQLVPQIASLLANHSLNKRDIGAFVVVSGPGSFTGLRVGLAAVKGLAEILQKPIVPVSLLEVIARSEIFVAAGREGGLEPLVCRCTTALDAGRGEAFVGQFEIGFTGKTMSAFRCTSGSLLTFEMLADLIESGTAHWTTTPDAVLADFLNARITSPAKSTIFRKATRPRIVEIATVAWAKLQAGQTVTPDQLEANYMRRSDAEMFVKQAPSC
jgi:tRNA threonylcarbamoyladenosine biosynthesis protein TsaB